MKNLIKKLEKENAAGMVEEMDDRKFIRTLIIIILIGIIITAAHSVYIYYAYQNSSIIQFIARELWL